MNAKIKQTKQITPSDVAKYYLYRSAEDGDLITPLKMQKLVYYAYVWTLVEKKIKLFGEQIAAWPNGPVVPSLYKELKGYGSSPIPTEYLGFNDDAGLKVFLLKFPADIKTTLDEVYEKYISKSAFELVVMTHSEKPWSEARRGLSTTEKSNNPLSDELIVSQYGQ